MPGGPELEISKYLACPLPPQGGEEFLRRSASAECWHAPSPVSRCFRRDGDTRRHLRRLQVKTDGRHGFSRYVNIIDRQIRLTGLLRKQRVRAVSESGEPIEVFTVDVFRRPCEVASLRRVISTPGTSA